MAAKKSDEPTVSNGQDLPEARALESGYAGRHLHSKASRDFLLLLISTSRIPNTVLFEILGRRLCTFKQPHHLQACQQSVFLFLDVRICCLLCKVPFKDVVIFFFVKNSIINE